MNLGPEFIAQDSVKYKEPDESDDMFEEEYLFPALRGGEMGSNEAPGAMRYLMLHTLNRMIDAHSLRRTCETRAQAMYRDGVVTKDERNLVSSTSAHSLKVADSGKI